MDMYVTCSAAVKCASRPPGGACEARSTGFDETDSTDRIRNCSASCWRPHLLFQYTRVRCDMLHDHLHEKCTEARARRRGRYAGLLKCFVCFPFQARHRVGAWVGVCFTSLRNRRCNPTEVSFPLLSSPSNVIPFPLSPLPPSEGGP